MCFNHDFGLATASGDIKQNHQSSEEDDNDNDEGVVPDVESNTQLSIRKRKECEDDRILTMNNDRGVSNRRMRNETARNLC
mmetsp:Transcript_29582/g.33204  ORF Transcript_29582/g.33204 Transcript_29582/m.33204 type:complete len:81 (-) Transcript_29582:297-539(-)